MHVDLLLGWRNGGQVYLDFIVADRELRDLMNLSDEEFNEEKRRLDVVRPLVIGLCKRIGHLCAETPLDRLCQSEIAKRTAHFVRAVMGLSGGNGSGSGIKMAEDLSLLPLPDDYALQELRTLTQTYMTEIINK